MAEKDSPKEGKGEAEEAKGKGEELVLSTLSVDDMREEQRIEMAKQLLMGRNVDKALEFIHGFDPIENIAKPLDEADFEIRDVEDQLQQRVQDWLSIWDKTMSESEDLPVDLIGRAVELAKSSREE